MSDPLSSETLRVIGQLALERVAVYCETLVDRPILQPSTSAALRALVDEPLPQQGAPFESLLAELDASVFRYSRHNGHPRFFGYISSPGTPATTIGSMIEAALNINVTAWRSGPASKDSK